MRTRHFDEKNSKNLEIFSFCYFLRVLFTAVGSALFRKVAENFEKAPESAGSKGRKMAKNAIFPFKIWPELHFQLFEII